MKKYEIYLPLKYNDGKKIESEKLIEIQQQLMAYLAVSLSALCLLHTREPGVVQV
jgi:hypothetical protein